MRFKKGFKSNNVTIYLPVKREQFFQLFAFSVDAEPNHRHHHPRELFAVEHSQNTRLHGLAFSLNSSRKAKAHANNGGFAIAITKVKIKKD